MKILKVLSLIVGISLFSIACGSGGGGGGGDDTPVNKLTSNIRTYKIGDSITYQLTVEDTSSGQKATGDVTFQITGEVTNPYGIKCKAYAITGTLTGAGGSYAYMTKSIFYQDAKGNLYDCGKYDENSAKYIFITDTPYTPDGLEPGIKNPVSVGNLPTGIVYYDDGSWDDCISKITGTETVETLMGKYETYIVSESCNYSNGLTSSETDYFFPSIYIVKGIVIDNDGYKWTLNMKSYTLGS